MPRGRRHHSHHLGGHYHWLPALLSPLHPAWQLGSPAPGQMRTGEGSACVLATGPTNVLPRSLLPSGSLLVLGVQTALAGLLEAWMQQSHPLFFPFPPLTSPQKPEGGAAQARAAGMPWACHQLCPWWGPSSGIRSDSEQSWLGRTLLSWLHTPPRPALPAPGTF